MLKYFTSKPPMSAESGIPVRAGHLPKIFAGARSGKILLMLLGLFSAFAANSQTITDVAVSGAPVCAGDNITVTFNANSGSGSDVYSSSSTYDVYMSNSSGNTFTQIGSGLTTSASYNYGGDGSTNPISLDVTIPTGTVPGTGYQISVGSSNPVFDGSTGSNASASFKVGPTSTTTAVTSIAHVTYGASSVTFSATVSDAGSETPGGTVQFQVGNTIVGSSTLNNGVATYDYDLTGVDAGTYPVTAIYSGSNCDFAGSTSSQTDLSVDKAPTSTTITLSGSSFTYTGSAIEPASVVVTGAGLNLTPDAAYADNTDAGTATASYSYAGDANHEASSDSKTFTIGKAASTTEVTINGTTFSYDGTALTPATVTVTGAGLNLTPDAAYADNTDAGTATASYSYAGDANHEPSSDSKTFTIDKAVTTTVVAINGSSFTYTGSTIEPATVTVTGGGLNLSPDAAYTDNTDAGTATASYAYAGDANHEASSDSKTFTIGKAVTTTVVTINGTSFPYDGTVHTPATVTVTGTDGLSLTPDADYADNMDAGIATASYSYAGDANHEASSDSKTFTIGKAATTTVIAITGTSFTYDGTAHTPATVMVTGTDGLSLTPDADYADNTDAGTATASYTFAGDANHEASSDSKTFTIDKAATTTVVSINGTTFTYDGTAQTPATVLVTGTDGLSLTPAATYADNTDAGTATASYTYAGDANHEPSNDSKTFTIDKASTTTVVSINGTTFTYDGTAQTPATVLVTGTDGLSLTPAASYADNTDAGTATASYAYTGDANHEASSDSKTFTIGKANAVIVVSGYSVTYDGSTQISSFTATGVEPTPANLGSLMDVSGTAHTDAGTYSSDAWSFAGDNNYNADGGTVVNTIGKANAIINVTGYNVTFDGIAQTSGFTAVGVESTPANLASLMDVSGTQHTNAGTYSADAWSFAGDNNYNAASGSVINTITARSITITADRASKVFGDVDPALTYTVTNLVAGDPATGALDRTAGEDMGAYAININTLTYGANYSETFVGNSLLISQATVSATVAADASVNYADQVTLTANVTADNSNAMSEFLANAGTVTFKALDQSGAITTLGQAIVASNGTATGSYVVTLAPGTYDILVDVNSASINVASVTNQSTNRVLTVNPVTTSISNSAVLQLEAKAYPNPSNGVFTVEIPKASKHVTTVRVMDIQGRVVATQQIEPGMTKVQMNTQNVGAGVYWIEVKNNGQSFQTKMVVN